MTDLATQATKDVRDELQPPSSGRRAGRTVRRLMEQAAFGVALLVAWEVLSGPVLNTLYFSQPSQIAVRFVEMVRSGELATHLRTSGGEFIYGYVIGLGAGIACGVLLALLPAVSRLVQPYLIAFYSVPNIALAPLFVIVFGIGIGSKIALVALGTFFFVFLTTYHGAISIDKEFINVARIMGASQSRVIRRILIPSAMPDILLGVRGAIPHALTGVIVGEFIASGSGIGWMVVNAANGFDTAGLFVGVMVIAIASLILTGFVRLAERILLPWSVNHASE
ncbi:MAG: ABC transporter permease [Nostocoides sp.]